MSSIEVTHENFSSFIEMFKINLRAYDKDCDRLEENIDMLEKDTQLKSKTIQNELFGLNNFLKEITDLSKLDSFFVDQKVFGRYISIDLNRSSDVLDGVECLFLKMKEDVKVVQFDIDRHMSNLNIKQGDYKTKPTRKIELELSCPKTNNSFIFATLQPGQRFQCIYCKKPIVLYSPFLRHMEEQPTGFRSMKLHYYHTAKECLIGRCFQKEYLSSVQVICEKDISGAVMAVLRDVGFKVENIRTKNDSDCENVTPESFLQQPEASQESTNDPRFVYKRRDKSDNKKVFCVACKCEILSDSYVYRGHAPDQPLHIAKKCVQSDQKTHVDFSLVKCHVSNLLRNTEELKQLLGCGFYYNKIVGVIPQKFSAKGDTDGQDCSVEQADITHFVYRRRDASLKQVVNCVGCKKGIFQSTYVTRGNTFAQPLHINKRCILADGATPADFSHFQCRVFRLLQDHNDLRQLLTCGFFYKNIIGYRPRKSDEDHSCTPPPSVVDIPAAASVTKDVGYIFNDKPFICARSSQQEQCQGCHQTINKTDLVLRHNEWIPQNNLSQSQLLDQFYHARMDCLIKRGFTERFLEFSLCQVSLSTSDKEQKVRDTLVRSGFSSNNISCTMTAERDSVDNLPSSSLPEKCPQLYIFVIVGKRENGHCDGCGFKIEVDEACFLYRKEDSLDLTKVFHLRESCLVNYFTKSELCVMICVNNSSMANVTADQIRACGLTIITERAPSGARGVAHVARRANLLKLVKPKFQVDLVRNVDARCSGCQEQLIVDGYVLVGIVPGDVPLRVHLLTRCLEKCGWPSLRLAQCDFTLQVAVTPSVVRALEECGFRHFATVARRPISASSIRN